MRYRHRLRTRIILSFLLLGFGLTALFAGTTVYLRSRLENQLIESWLLSEADNFVQFKRANPEPDARFSFSRQIEAYVYRPDSASIALRIPSEVTSGASEAESTPPAMATSTWPSRILFEA